METQNYQNLIDEIIAKQTIILGPDIVLLKARNVKGLNLSSGGKVESIDGDPQEVFYNLMMSTKLYGGIIGKAVRLIGVATMLVAVASIENVLLKFKIVEHSLTASVFQDLLILVSLVLLGIAFSKLGSVNKQ